MIENQDKDQNDAAAVGSAGVGPEFAIQRIYVKDLSFEAPSVPAIFQQQWKPELNLQIQANTVPLENNTHEVSLALTVTVKNGENVAFLVEVKQAGIFTVKEFPEDQTHAILGSVCPSILFPYAREVVSDIVTRGGFPQLVLAPVNFDALYAQHLEQQGQAKSVGEEKTH